MSCAGGESSAACGRPSIGTSFTCCPQRIQNTLCLPPRDCPPPICCAPIWTPCCSPPGRCCGINCCCLCRLPRCPPAYYACPHKTTSSCRS